jgi:glutamate synthase (NADPH/NADH) small chain
MGNPTAFKSLPREQPKKRPVEERIHDWRELYLDYPEEKQREQASRCMDCGIPFCNQGCPLGNLIPEWNDFVYRGRWREAIEALHKTNNFPEFTGRICPAPCEASCVLSINAKPVSIKLSEVSIIDRAYREGWVVPRPPSSRTGKKIAVVGSGPAGLAAAAQLNKAGHSVTVFERAQRIGGLLTFGIPDFKLEKRIVDRRVDLMKAEGVEFRPGTNVGFDITAEQLRRDFDAIVLCGGSTRPRDVNIPGRELDGIYFAMDYLTRQNELNYGDPQPDRPLISAKDKHVLIIGGGDTGADCLGTAHRHGAKGVTQIEIFGRPPEERAPYNPWPQWPMTISSSPAHEEGGEREWAVQSLAFRGEGGKVKALQARRLKWTVDEKGRRTSEEIPGSDFEIPAELVLIAAGFLGPETAGPIEQLGLELDQRGNVKTDANYMSSVEGVFAAGDMRRGQSLVVWAIAEGRKAARGVDAWLMGRSDLPG